MTEYVISDDRALVHTRFRDAQKIGEALEALVAAGKDTPEAVVRASRAKRAPLHECFTWDDQVAGEMWRIEEAKRIFRAVHVKVDENGGGTMRAFHSVVRDEDADARFERRYVSLRVVENDPALADEVIQRAKTELIAWSERHRSLRDHFKLVFEAIDLELVA